MKRSLAFVLASALLTLSPLASQAADTPAANKKLVLEFYDTALNKRDADAALKYLGDKYIQHNPMAPDGAAGVKGLIEMLKAKYPQGKNEIKRSMAEGNLVMLHVHSKTGPDDRGRAIVDIFRVENGKIVEHWDVMQAIPEKAANDNTMF